MKGKRGTGHGFMSLRQTNTRDFEIGCEDIIKKMDDIKAKY
jgi:hypothetical protein